MSPEKEVELVNRKQEVSAIATYFATIITHASTRISQMAVCTFVGYLIETVVFIERRIDHYTHTNYNFLCSVITIQSTGQYSVFLIESIGKLGI
jgi:hypothetical protein